MHGACSCTPLSNIWEYTVCVLLQPSVTSHLAATRTPCGKRSICLAMAEISGTGMYDRDPISARFIGFKELSPGVPKNLVRYAKWGGF